MDLLSKERDRLLHDLSRLVGILATGVAFACLSVPGVLPWTSYLATLPLFALLIVAHARSGGSVPALWVALGAAAGLGIMLVAILSPSGVPLGDVLLDDAGLGDPLDTPLDGAPAAADEAVTASVATSLAVLGAGGLGAFALLLVSSVRQVAVLAALGAVTTGLVAAADWPSAGPPAATAIGWAVLGFTGVWLRQLVPMVSRSIRHIGRAHQVERHSSETEARRRQGARLLHDTVLATLTLLAHSGVGVSPTALRQQAGDDARLLRQLRMGATPTPQSSGQYLLEPVAETELGTTLESVKQRFSRMGLEVSWHGTGQVLLPSHVLDAFLMALAECLENVRRHAQVTQADVTITTDEQAVRAMVTDSGVGFDIDEIDEHRLGLRESVVGRLQEVGGTAKLFSTPGQGTTVVLEVPR
ncbi:sensor histidine kinase [Ruicaihuangia caeni]|uniref:Histidine kinase n=1 Tax=Ruicaihuangia caeni TaxID=3042517 RepID=A0AAW6T0T2_9MICO|nr:ATP-binding protein [Klugiella sp. YN-L-19]MDI2097431.1 histidine kinase [Klugiella sp. YN-L-19]